MASLAVFLLPFAGCGRHSRPEPAPASSTNDVAQPPVEAVATTLGRAAVDGDRAGGIALTLTFDEVAGISRTAAEKGERDWNDETNAFFTRMAREGVAMRGADVGARLVFSKRLSPDDENKLRRAVEAAVVQLTVERSGEEPRPLGQPILFMKTEAGWRFSPVSR